MSNKHLIITLDSVSKYYGSVRAVDNVSLSIGRGQMLVLLGSSGCGKTTALRLIAGLERPDAGEIWLDGDLVAGNGHWTPPEQRRIGMVFQDYALFPHLTSMENIAFPLHSQTAQQRRARVEDLLALVGMEGMGDRYPHQLSGGMLQRVAIAQALASDPKIIVLDEPVSALDVSIRAQIMNLLQDLRRDLGVSFFMISHDLATMRYLSDEIGVMYLGKLVEYGPADQVFDEPRHPYTAALLSAAPEIRPGSSRRSSSRIVLAGDIPSPEEPQQGCSFHTRCPLWLKLDRPSVCVEEDPVLQSTGENHSVACHFWESTRAELAPTGVSSGATGDTSQAANRLLETNAAQDQEHQDERADRPW